MFKISKLLVLWCVCIYIDFALFKTCQLCICVLCANLSLYFVS